MSYTKDYFSFQHVIMHLRKFVDYANKLCDLLLSFLVYLVYKLHAVEGDVDQVSIQQEVLGTFVSEYHEE